MTFTEEAFRREILVSELDAAFTMKVSTYKTIVFAIAFILLANNGVFAFRISTESNSTTSPSNETTPIHKMHREAILGTVAWSSFVIELTSLEMPCIFDVLKEKLTHLFLYLFLLEALNVDTLYATKCRKQSLIASRIKIIFIMRTVCFKYKRLQILLFYESFLQNPIYHK